MKRYSFALLLLVSMVSHAQTRFKDIFPLLAGYTPSRQKDVLKQFLNTDLDHPNTNFRLALLYEANYKKADPLTDNFYALANANQSKIRYLKSKQLVDEKEVNRNQEYYAPIFKLYDAKGNPAVPFAKVSSKMIGGYDSANLFLEKIPAIYQAFTKSVNFYDQSVRTFAGITEEFTSMEDLYLLLDESVDSRLGNIKINYDSSLFYLDKYLALIKTYPIHGHQPTYKIRPVVTYRLDGLLTNVNFLTDQIQLWDYSTWVIQVRAKVSTEVADLRKKIVSTNEQMDETLSKIATSATTFPTPVKVDKKLIFNLNNFDRQSFVLSLLEYKAYKQELDIQNKSKQLDTTSTARNAEVFSQLIYSNRKADTLVKEFKSRLIPSKVRKHQQFTSKFYGGQPGLEKYTESQQVALQDSYTENSQLLRTNLLGLNLTENSFTNKEGVLRYSRFTIPLAELPAKPEAFDQGLLFTQFNQKNPDGSSYLAGIYKPDKKKNLVSTYVVRINPDGKLAWFKDINVSVDSAAVRDAHCYLGSIVLTQEGSALVIRSIHATRGEAINTFIYLNEKGEVKATRKLEAKSFPRFILYNEKSNSFALFLKGSEEKEKFNANEPIDAIGINVLGEITWKKEGISLTGTFTDVMSLSDGYLLAGSYFILNDDNGKEVRTKSSTGECSPYIIKLSERGVLIFSKPIVSTGSFYLHRCIKINDMSVQLLGQAQTMEIGTSSIYDPKEKQLHIMTNKFGQLISTLY